MEIYSAVVEINNVCIMTQVGICSEIYYEPSGNPSGSALRLPSCSAYISPYIPPLVIIQIQSLYYKIRCLLYDRFLLECIVAIWALLLSQNLLSSYLVFKF